MESITSFSIIQSLIYLFFFPLNSDQNLFYFSTLLSFVTTSCWKVYIAESTLHIVTIQYVFPSYLQLSGWFVYNSEWHSLGNCSDIIFLPLPSFNLSVLLVCYIFIYTEDWLNRIFCVICFVLHTFRADIYWSYQGWIP